MTEEIPPDSNNMQTQKHLFCRNSHYTGIDHPHKMAVMTQVKDMQALLNKNLGNSSMMS